MDQPYWTSHRSAKRTRSEAFPEQWCRRHSKRLKRVDQDLLPREAMLEKEIAELEIRWDGLYDEAHRIYESIGAEYDTVRQRIRAFPTQDDNIAIDMSYREGISMTRELYNDAERLRLVLETAQLEAKHYEELLLNNYVEYLKVRDNWLGQMKKLAEITDQADAIVFRHSTASVSEQ
jgi:hypothetical protein